jgi:chromosome segregation ATPase
MKVKLLTAWSNDRESYAFGDMIDLDDATAAEWIEHGLAIEAPPEEFAAQRVGELSAALDEANAARDGLEKELTDARGKLAAAQKEKQGAIAEADVHRKAADAFKAERDVLRALLAEKKSAKAPEPPKL